MSMGDGLLIVLVYVCGVIALLGALEVGLAFCVGLIRPALAHLMDRVFWRQRRAGRLHLVRVRFIGRQQ